MKGLVYKEIQKLTLEERPEPLISQPDDVIVKVLSTGICGTDRNIYLGRFQAKPGVILGHESVGIVVAVGNGVKNLTKGDRVIINPTLHCGYCDYCRRGELNFCNNKQGTEVGVDRDGTFADFVVLPEQFLHKIPDGMSLDQAVLVEPVACVLNNATAANLVPSDDVAVIGAGPIGMMWGLFAQKVALRVIMIESDPFRIDFAKQRIKRVIDASKGNLLDAVININRERKPSLVIDTTGVMLEQALELVGKGGRVVVMGFNTLYKASISPQYLVSNGIKIIGAGDYNSNIFPIAIELASEMNLEELITHKFSIEKYNEAFGLLCGNSVTTGDKANYQAMKVLLTSV